MRHPWQIWTLYAACLAIALPALGWLSVQAVHLERARESDQRQTEWARREAELQERINSALWRMDGMLTPLIAQEAARPYYLYESFFLEPARTSGATADENESGQRSGKLPFASTLNKEMLDQALPSPLMKYPSEYVFLHFQLGPEDVISSPQRPTGLACVQALSCCGVTEQELASQDQRIAELQKVLDYNTLLLQCPDEKLPAVQPLLPESATIDRTLSQQTGQPDVAATRFVDPKLQQAQQLFQSEKSAGLSGQSRQSDQDPVASEWPLQKQMAQQTRNILRGNEEFVKRSQSADNYTTNQWLGNQLTSVALTPSVFVQEGIMRPLWMGDQLLLVRRVESDGAVRVQGCWLDWEKIKNALRREVEDLLPVFRFQPLENVDDVRLGQALATIPVQLDIDRASLLAGLELDPALAPPGSARSGIGIALGVAWGCLGLAAIAGAFLLHGLIQLSERRGAFVSAVTHELRTPLTTFRMYAEMLAERMVPSADKQQQYAETMRVEADRLSHLVENVLQFARLERSERKCRQETLTWERLWERFCERLEQRCDQAGMELVDQVDPADAGRSFRSDPAAIEQIVFNLVDNACKYARDAADPRVVVSAHSQGNRFRIGVRDFGPGVSPQMERRMFKPFRKSDQQAADTAQGVGLGLALCRRMARSLGGQLTCEPVEPGAQLVLDLPLTGSGRTGGGA